MPLTFPPGGFASGRLLLMPRSYKDLTGKRFGRLTCVRRVGANKWQQALWLCACKCGNEHVVIGTCLVEGNSRSCGCFARERHSGPAIKMVGRRFGLLKVLRLAGRKQWTQDDRYCDFLWRCVCKCGKKKIASGHRLRQGIIQSCGCLRHLKGKKNRNYKHGGTNTAHYRTWSGMKQRCFNEKSAAYPDYGGRGITMCLGWRGPDGFVHFREDMGKRPKNKTIDRRNVDGNYSCGHCEECLRMGWTANCKWATDTEQNNNRRSNTWYKAQKPEEVQEMEKRIAEDETDPTNIF